MPNKTTDLPQRELDILSNFELVLSGKHSKKLDDNVKRCKELSEGAIDLAPKTHNEDIHILAGILPLVNKGNFAICSDAFKQYNHSSLSDAIFHFERFVLDSERAKDSMRTTVREWLNSEDGRSSRSSSGISGGRSGAL